MPLVRIDLQQGRSPQDRQRLGEIVYAAMRATIDVPENDKFLIVTEHAPGDLQIAETYLGSRFSDGVILIQITLNFGRSLERKKALYKKIVDDLGAQMQVRPDDVVINLVETAKENWSFGRGIAQYAE
jgi:phenylpyruvate tautomerase PptA (4-oxalocrotonate tautomerase family)